MPRLPPPFFFLSRGLIDVKWHKVYRPYSKEITGTKPNKNTENCRLTIVPSTDLIGTNQGCVAIA